MSLIDCIIEKIQRGALSKAEGERIIALTRDLEREHAKRMSPEAAMALAAEDVSRILDADAARQKRVAHLEIIATARVTKAMNEHPEGMATGAISLLVRDVTDNARGPNVDIRHREVLGTLHAMFAEGIERLRPKVLGLVPERAALRNVVRELFGEATGDAEAKAMAKAWAESAEYARQRINTAGAHIAKREDWGLPQMHDHKLVGDAPKNEWVDFVFPRLNREKMVDPISGMKLDDMRVLDALDKAHERIRTDGLIDMVPGVSGRAGKLADRHADHRFLVFKDAQSWLEYQERFGSGDVYATMTHHLDVMSKDIAMLEVLGPNPDATVRYMADAIRKNAALKGEKIPGVSLKLLDDIYAIQTGRANRPANEPVAEFMSGVRNILTSAQLGAAFLSSITDLGFQKVAREFNGLPVMSVMRNYLKFMNPRGAEDRVFAAQLGLVSEHYTSMMLAQRRYFGDTMGPEITRKISDVVLRASLLSTWTQAGRWAFGAEFMGFLGRNVGKPLKELPDGMQRAFQRYGIGADEWDTIRAAPVLEKDGAPFVWTRRIAEQGSVETASKLHRMVLSEMEFAVPTVDTRTLAITRQGTQAGTLVGEIMRSVALYKSFPVSVITTHIMRGLNQRTGTKAGLYLANLFITSTALGALAYQAKQIQRGKDPLNMDPTSKDGRRLWAAAMAQGGGLGIFGDFVFADASRFGGGPAVTFAGPVAGLIDDMARLTVGNAQQAAKGKDTHIGRETTRFIGRYLPGNSIWYSRLAFERLVLDQTQQMVDPEAGMAFNRIESVARREYGQRYWWRPGKPLPSRPPDLGATRGK